MLLAAGGPRRLGGAEPRLRFGPAPGRTLLLDDEPAYELSWPCGTCQLLFKRMGGANQTLSLDELRLRLSDGVDGVDGVDDPVAERFGALLEQGTYVPLLLSVRPRLVHPGGDGDYFSEEQVATWGVTSFWGLPEYPSTPYYRTFETAVDDGAHLYEFVVPMVPPRWYDPGRVAEHARALAASDRPTAVALSTLDVCRPATDTGADPSDHWGLTHFLLDGHHKTFAAAENGLPLRLLSLLSVEGSLASPDEVALVPGLRSRPPAVRTP